MCFGFSADLEARALFGRSRWAFIRLAMVSHYVEKQSQGQRLGSFPASRKPGFRAAHRANKKPLSRPFGLQSLAQDQRQRQRQQQQQQQRHQHRHPVSNLIDTDH